jgi:hypothetical protein
MGSDISVDMDCMSPVQTSIIYPKKERQNDQHAATHEWHRTYQMAILIIRALGGDVKKNRMENISSALKG